MSGFDGALRDLVVEHQWRPDFGLCACSHPIGSPDDYGRHIGFLAWRQGYDAGTAAPSGSLGQMLSTPLPERDDNPYDNRERSTS